MTLPAHVQLAAALYQSRESDYDWRAFVCGHRGNSAVRDALLDRHTGVRLRLVRTHSLCDSLEEDPCPFVSVHLNLGSSC